MAFQCVRGNRPRSEDHNSHTRTNDNKDNDGTIAASNRPITSETELWNICRGCLRFDMPCRRGKVCNFVNSDK